MLAAYKSSLLDAASLLVAVEGRLSYISSCSAIFTKGCWKMRESQQMVNEEKFPVMVKAHYGAPPA